MTKLFYVKGYHHRLNEWWRYVVTADTEAEAVRKVEQYANTLSEVSAMYLCRTPDELYLDL